MRKVLFGFASVAMIGGAALTVSAAPITVNNGDFEVPNPADAFNGGPTTSQVYQWSTSTGNNSDYSWGQQRPGNPTGNGSGANSTNTYAFMWHTGNGQSIYQNLGEAITAGQTYTLTGYIKALDPTTSGSIRLYSFSAASGEVPVSQLATSSVVSYSASDNPWTLVTATYVAPATGGYLGAVLYRNTGDQDKNLFFDQVTAGVVPEPASLGLLGAAGLLAMRRRRIA